MTREEQRKQYQLCLASSSFFSIWDFFHERSWITGLQWKWKTIFLTNLYPVHRLHIHLDISQVTTTEGSPLHIASDQIQTGKSLSAERKYDQNMIKLMDLKIAV